MHKALLMLPLLACGAEPLSDVERPRYTVACVEELCSGPDGADATCTWRCVQHHDHNHREVYADVWQHGDTCGDDEPGLPVDGMCARLYGGP